MLSGSKKNTLYFLLLLGMVSLFADVTYEGARSISGAFLSFLGASALGVALIAGFGEWVGYSFRIVSGLWSDKKKTYWVVTILGYAISLSAIPLLAFARTWQIAALFLILERLGKAIRSPPRDAMLSYMTQRAGRGWGFGLHESLDQVGAILGPLLVAAVLAWGKGYATLFAYLAIPAIMAFLLLLTTWRTFPQAEKGSQAELPPSLSLMEALQKFPKKFWVFLFACSLVGAGFVDFALIAFHLEKTKVLDLSQIPIFYAVAMGIHGMSTFCLGTLFDRFGFSLLLVGICLSAFFAPFIFVGGFTAILVGVFLWGIGMGIQESIFRAGIAQLSPPHYRGTAYGLFYLVFGLSWFLGSAFMGFLYERSLLFLILFSLSIQLLSLPLFFHLSRKKIRQ